MTYVGLLGGTFNPPHNGHVRLAERARAHFDIDPLRVLVSTSPPHKRVDVDVETRLELARLAFPDAEVVRDDNPYSIDTVTGYGDDAVFLVGADQFAKFLTWREPDDDIRQRVARGEPIDDLVPPAVAAEIERLGLYRRDPGYSKSA